MYYGEKRVENPIRWGMVGGGRGSQIGYIHRNSALRDRLFTLCAGAFDVNEERGREFGVNWAFYGSYKEAVPLYDVCMGTQL